MKIISNSEITTFNECTRRHYYAYVLEIGPKELNLPIYRGVIGHSALDSYYTELKAGETVESARKAAFAVIDKEIARIVTETPEEFERLQICVKLKKLIEAYSEHYRVEPFRVLETEKVYTAPISVEKELEYGGILDLVIEYTAGPYRGDIAVVDHKFVYNFKSIVELEMDAQLPKFIKVLRANGYTVSKALFNQIRHRDLKNPSPDDIFKRVPARTNNFAIEEIWAEQVETADEIANYLRPPRRTLSQMVCKGCFYASLCKAELNGEDVSNMIASDYIPRKRPLKDLAKLGE